MHSLHELITSLHNWKALCLRGFSVQEKAILQKTLKMSDITKSYEL